MKRAWGWWGMHCFTAYNLFPSLAWLNALTCVTNFCVAMVIFIATGGQPIWAQLALSIPNAIVGIILTVSGIALLDTARRVKKGTAYQ